MTVYSAMTHPGCKRELNEDCVGCDDASSIWLVTDGMGGHAAGEVASRLVKDKVLEDVSTGTTLKDAVMNAHLHVCESAKSNTEQAGMGTTIVAAKLINYTAEIVWVGDSRAYLWRNGKLSVVTKDHSFLQMLLDSQQLSPEDAHNHPQRNIVTQVVGVGDPHPDRLSLRLRTHDWLLLCSDGLNDELRDSEIENLLRDSPDVESAVARLVDAACNNGGRDNVSAIVVQYDGENSPAEDPATIKREVVQVEASERTDDKSLVSSIKTMCLNRYFWLALLAVVAISIVVL